MPTPCSALSAGRHRQRQLGHSAPQEQPYPNKDQKGRHERGRIDEGSTGRIPWHTVRHDDLQNHLAMFYRHSSNIAVFPDVSRCPIQIREHCRNHRAGDKRHREKSPKARSRRDRDNHALRGASPRPVEGQRNNRFLAGGFSASRRISFSRVFLPSNRCSSRTCSCSTRYCLSKFCSVQESAPVPPDRNGTSEARAMVGTCQSPTESRCAISR